MLSGLSSRRDIRIYVCKGREPDPFFHKRFCTKLAFNKEDIIMWVCRTSYSTCGSACQDCSTGGVPGSQWNGVSLRDADRCTIWEKPLKASCAYKNDPHSHISDTLYENANEISCLWSVLGFIARQPSCEVLKLHYCNYQMLMAKLSPTSNSYIDTFPSPTPWHW